MAEFEGKTVHLVGHCGPDTFMLKSVIERALPGVGIESVNSHDGLSAALGETSLLMVNRVLDGGFTTESGLELIRSVDGTPAMLISNFADAQAEAESAGALPGFGKSEMGSPEANERLVGALKGGDR